MKSELESVSNLEKKLKIEVPAQAVNEEFQRAYKYLQKEVNIKGFRKGKAPLQTIRGLYSEKIKSDVLQNLFQNNYWPAIREHKLVPVTDPTIDSGDLQEDAPFTFTANFEIRPEVKIQKKSGFKLEKEKVNTSDEKVNAVLDNIRQSNATFESVTEDRALANKDYALIDFEGTMNGAPLEGGTAQGHTLEIGANQFIPGFEEALVGMKKSEVREINLTFPADYHAEHLKSQPVTFKVTLQDIKSKKLPELDEELLKKIGQTSKDELVAQIKKDMEEGEKNRIDQALREALSKTFVEANPVEVPRSLVTRYREAVDQDTRSRLKQQGMPDEDVETYMQKWAPDLDQQADFLVRSEFLIDQLADDEKLHATDADVEARYDKMAQQFGMEKEKIKSFYREREAGFRLKHQITQDKVFEYLINNSQIEEVEKPKS